jgi:hypothetical protein
MAALFPGDHPDKEVTLNSSEAELVAGSHGGQEVVYLCELLNSFGHQKEPTEIWEDNGSCIIIMMSENPTNRDRSRHVHVKVHYLRDILRWSCKTCQMCRYSECFGHFD